MRAIPGRKNFAEIDNDFVHLLVIECVADHDAHATGFGGDVFENVVAEEEFFDQFVAEFVVFFLEFVDDVQKVFVVEMVRVNRREGVNVIVVEFLFDFEAELRVDFSFVENRGFFRD